jgi:hypothetical protein
MREAGRCHLGIGPFGLRCTYVTPVCDHEIEDAMETPRTGGYACRFLGCCRATNHVENSSCMLTHCPQLCIDLCCVEDDLVDEPPLIAHGSVTRLSLRSAPPTRAWTGVGRCGGELMLGACNAGAHGGRALPARRGPQARRQRVLPRGAGESKRLVVESPWSQLTSECQRC